MGEARAKVSANATSFHATMRGVGGAFRDIGRSMRTLVGPIAGLVVGLASVTTGVYAMNKAIREGADMESLELSFTTLLKDAQKAKDLIAEVVKFADQTPREIPELANAAKQMIAFGVASKDIIPTLRMLNDVASGLNIGLGEIADVYGRNLVQGKLFARDIYQFQGRGIPIVKELAKQFGVAEDKVMDLVSAGKVGSRELTRAFESMTEAGGQFSGMTERQSQSFYGRLSTLKDAINSRFRDIGRPLVDGLKPFINEGIAYFESLKDRAVQIGETLKAGLLAAITAIKDGRFLELLGSGILALMETIRNSVRGIMGDLAESANLEKIGAAIMGVGAALSGVLLSAFKPVVQFVVAGMTMAGHKMANALVEAIPPDIRKWIQGDALNQQIEDAKKELVDLRHRDYIESTRLEWGLEGSDANKVKRIQSRIRDLEQIVSSGGITFQDAWESAGVVIEDVGKQSAENLKNALSKLFNIEFAGGDPVANFKKMIAELAAQFNGLYGQQLDKVGGQAAGGANGKPGGLPGGLSGSGAALATSIQQIGGGGRVANVDLRDPLERANAKLEKIEKNTATTAQQSSQHLLGFGGSPFEVV